MKNLLFNSGRCSCIFFSLSIIIVQSLSGQQIQFAKTYPITNNCHANDFIQLNDSGFIIVGGYKVPGNSYRALMMRINKYGDTVWTKQFTWADEFYSIVDFDDTTFIVTAIYNPISVFAFNINGDSLWSHSYNLSLPDVSVFIYKTQDKGYILTNGSNSGYRFLKLDSNFMEQWHDDDNMYDGGIVYPDIDDGFVAGGEGGFYHNPYTVQRRNSQGSMLWNYNYGNMPGNTNDYTVRNVIVLPDSNYLASCDGYDWNLMKIDRNTGDTIWTRSYPFFAPFGLYNMLPRGSNINSTDYFLVGSGYIYKIDTAADTLWFHPIFDSKNLKTTNDHGIAYCGAYLVGASQLLLFVKCDSIGNTVISSVFNPENNFQPLTIYPNPATDKLYINAGTMINEKRLLFSLTDLQGRSVLNEQYEASLPIDVSTLPGGIYIATLKGKEKEVRGKVVIQR
ncbi:MAG: T9SS type A sorting domain-containing protein [Bacteroidia bacterium]